MGPREPLLPQPLGQLAAPLQRGESPSGPARAQHSLQSACGGLKTESQTQERGLLKDWLDKEPHKSPSPRVNGVCFRGLPGRDFL